MLSRAYTISSCWSNFSDEVDKLKTMFINNGYPRLVMDRCVNKFLTSKFVNQPDKVKHDTVEKSISLPYIGFPSILFARKIQAIFKKYYHIDIKIVFNTTKVKNYFSLKCRTPFCLKAKVVYQFNCLVDPNTSYIGKTKRHLAVRVKEHGKKESAIKNHLSTCETCKLNYGLDLFKIIDNGISDFDCKVKEAIHIKNSRPNLNRQLFASGAGYTLNVFR